MLRGCPVHFPSGPPSLIGKTHALFTLLISYSGRPGIIFQPFFSDFIWLGWRTNSDLSFSSCSGCDLKSSAITSTATIWLYDLWNKPDKDSMAVSWRPPIICEPSRQILDWLLFLHSLKLVRSVNMCSGGTSDYDVTRGALHSLAQATGQSSWTGCLDCSLSPSSKNNFPLRFHPSFPTAPSKQNTPMAGLQTQRTDSRTSSPVSQTRIYTYTHVCVGVREWTVIAAVWGLVRHGSWQ